MVESNTEVKELASHKIFAGQQRVYEHRSAALKCQMRFAIYQPTSTQQATTPAIIWLSGLTASEQNFITKAGAQRVAAELGLAVVCVDTSPRGEQVANDDAYDLGQGASFYLNAVQSPWNQHFQMQDYLTQEIPELLRQLVPNLGKLGISGHSMGGHGALTLHLKFPQLFVSCSAFAPIAAPMQCAWGEKAFKNYLGDDSEVWKEHDATQLIVAGRKGSHPILIDQGLDDEFLKEQLKPELFLEACERNDQAVQYRSHVGYDHSYYFIASFVEDHLRFHHNRLQ